MAANQIIVSCLATSTLRKNVIYIPPKFTTPIVIGTFYNRSSSKIIHFRRLAKRLVPQAHGRFTVDNHFFDFHFSKREKLLNLLLSGSFRNHMINHRVTYRYQPQRAILIIALQKISWSSFFKKSGQFLNYKLSLKYLGQYFKETIKICHQKKLTAPISISFELIEISIIIHSNKIMQLIIYIISVHIFA